MAWHDGNGSRGNPGRSVATLPDLEGLLRRGRDWLRQMLPGGDARRVVTLAVAVVVGLIAWASYYTVPSDSVAIVQRFGKYLKEVQPGLHFKLPLGIDV
ncbi:MAG: HflK protein, partial [Chromatiales bacterium]|nr:HflK protein [Chromatiales bacterium]